MKPDLTVEDWTIILNIIDTAIKAAGLDCAVVAVPIAQKLRAAYAQHVAELAKPQARAERKEKRAVKGKR